MSTKDWRTMEAGRDLNRRRQMICGARINYTPTRRDIRHIPKQGDAAPNNRGSKRRRVIRNRGGNTVERG